MGKHTKSIMEADTTPKNQRLSIAQLAQYDDLLTDVLVDKVYFWTNIKKNRTKYSQTRGFSEEQVCHVLFNDIVLAKDVPAAEAHLLELPGIKRFYGTLKSSKERDDFRKHMQKYISIWLPDCPFEVSTTNRYTITQHEASTTARQPISRGETIKYLCGNLVAMTPEEEKEIELNRRDFSVVKQVRKKISSLFLGPARFANHDCKANARLCQQGMEGMTIVAIRDIELGEEITVDYGTHYFNHNNRDCLCATCEERVRNGWAQRSAGEEDEGLGEESETSGEDSGDPSTTSASRKRPLDLEEKPGEDGEHELGRTRKHSRLNSGQTKSATGLTTPPESTEKSSSGSGQEMHNLTVEGSGNGSDSSDPILTPKEKTRLGRVAHRASDTISPRSFYGTQQQVNSNPKHRPKGTLPKTHAIDPEMRYLVEWLGTPSPQNQQVTRKSLWITPSRYSSSKNDRTRDCLVPGDDYEVPQGHKEPSNGGHRSVSHHMTGFSASRAGGNQYQLGPTPPLSSTLSSTAPGSVEMDDIYGWDGEKQLVKKGRPRKPFHKLSSATRAKYLRRGKFTDHSGLAEGVSAQHMQGFKQERSRDQRQDEDEEEDDSDDESVERIPRTPGDYIRTRALLSVPTARWTDCGTCPNTWVQTARDTSRECPRCERHSKLYGYRWPKTEPKDANDEKRITDHRLVHRILRKDEDVPRRGRGLDKPESQGKSGRSSEEPEEEDGARKLRKTHARAHASESMAGLGMSEVDLRALEKNNPKVRSGKGWVMLVDE